MSVVERLSGVLDRRLSRRSFVVRAAFSATALSTGGLSYLLQPGRAYASICSCAGDCACGSSCCAPYTEFCCVINGGYNSCPSGTIMAGWWKADGSVYCDGPRYYMDCNGVCSCTDGCGGGYQFCDPACDGLSCGCAEGSCDHYREGCFQFRYGQCNQDVACIGRIKCRVVTCVPPWEIDPTCTRTNAEDDGAANQNAACLTAGPTLPPPVCSSPQTDCKAVGIAMAAGGRGYAIVTSEGRTLAFGDQVPHGNVGPRAHPLVGIAGCGLGGYWLAGSNGRVLAVGTAQPYGDAAFASPVVGMAATGTGRGYWLVSRVGAVHAFGDAAFHGHAVVGGHPRGFVGMAGRASGAGYWLATAGGGVLAFGDAIAHGGTAPRPLSDPIVGICSTPSGGGYWLVAASGTVFAFGDASHLGGAGARPHTYPVVAMAPTPTGDGYVLATADGHVFPFGDAVLYGSAA